MIWIDLKHKRPTDSDIPGWVPWSKGEWEAWLLKSKQLVATLAELNDSGDLDARNAFIDANSAHWSELKPWLLALSGNKCWFSETRDLFSHYDVEHFRPKKEAKELDKTKNRDGYWWLAFDYMNLRICGTVGNRKKGGWFPLQPNSVCSTFEHQCEEAESPLLIDPIDDDDVDLIAFDEEGNVVPAPGISDWDVQRVTETVKRLKLNEHVALSEARRKTWYKVSELIEEFNSAKARCKTGPNPFAKACISQVRARIREMTNRSAELSSVAQWCIRLRNDPQLSRLISNP